MVPEVTKEIPKLTMNFDKKWIPAEAQFFRKMIEGVCMAAVVILSLDTNQVIRFSFGIIIASALVVIPKVIITEDITLSQQSLRQLSIST